MFAFFLKVILAIWIPLKFHNNFSMCFSIPDRNEIEILVGIGLNLYTVLGDMHILTILNLPVDEHEMSFHLFVSSSTTFSSVLWFSVYKCLTSFSVLFCHFLYYYKWNSFLKFLFNSSFLVHEISTDLCVLICICRRVGFVY